MIISVLNILIDIFSVSVKNIPDFFTLRPGYAHIDLSHIYPIVISWRLDIPFLEVRENHPAFRTFESERT